MKFGKNIKSQICLYGKKILKLALYIEFSLLACNIPLYFVNEKMYPIFDKKDFNAFEKTVDNIEREIDGMNFEDDFSKILAVEDRLFIFGIDGKNPINNNHATSDLYIGKYAGIVLIKGKSVVCKHLASFCCETYKKLGMDASLQAIIASQSVQFASKADIGIVYPSENPYWEIANHIIVRLKNVKVKDKQGKIRNIEEMFFDPMWKTVLVREYGSSNLIILNSDDKYSAEHLTKLKLSFLMENYDFVSITNATVRNVINSYNYGYKKEEIDDMRELLGLDAQLKRWNEYVDKVSDGKFKPYKGEILK